MRPVVGVVCSVVVGVIVLLSAGRASAVPESYQFTSGSAVLTAFHVVDVGGVDQLNLVGGPLNISLDGIQVSVDEAALQILSIDLSSAGPWVLPVDIVAMGGYDAITISNATLTGGDGSMTFIDPGPPRAYDYDSTPVVVISDLLATGPAIPPVFVPAFVMNSPSASGTLFLTGTGVGAMLTIDGLTIADFTSPFTGRRAIVKADFVFEGVNPVPEPGSALLLGIAIGVLGVAARTRAR